MSDNVKCRKCGTVYPADIDHGCAPVTDKGLDFEAAEKEGWVPSPIGVEGTVIWDDPKWRAHLNAQLATRIAAARAEEREAHATYVNNAAVGVADEVRRQYAPLVAAWREWVEARKALKGKPVARPFADSALVKNLRDAEAALAAIDLGGAE